MEIKQNPFAKQLIDCVANIGKLEEQLATEKGLKNTLLTNMENFYTDELKGLFLCSSNGKKLGQISHVFAKNSKLFVHLYLLEMTINSKITKRYSNLELFGEEMKDFALLSEAEYKDAFFEYVNERIKPIENETK